MILHLVLGFAPIALAPTPSVSDLRAPVVIKLATPLAPEFATPFASESPTPFASEFAVPFRIADAHGPISVDVGHAAPLIADFDGDGVPDLFVGQFGDGKLRIYKNRGSINAPRYDGFTWFKTGEQEGRIPSG